MLLYVAMLFAVSHHYATTTAMAFTTTTTTTTFKNTNLKHNFNNALHASVPDNDATNDGIMIDTSSTNTSRRSLLHHLTSTFVVGTATMMTYVSQPITAANAVELPKSYSSNARNLNRISSGDSSGGSVYDNYPKTEKAARRRAMEGCKVDSARKEAKVDGGLRECNLRVMDGDTEFMLDALRALDCPECPYGIKGA